MFDLGHNNLRIGEKAFAIIAHDAGKMVNMAMGENDGIYVVGLDARRRQRVLEAAIDSARAFLYAASVMLLVRRIARAS
jgi:hypothetical protein